MKKNVLLAFTTATLIFGTSANAAFQSQTLLRNTSGLIQTLPAVTADYNLYTPGFREPFIVKNAALLYDKRNPLPTLMVVGANYAFFKGGVMVTVSENGSLYYKGITPVQPASGEAARLGGNFFLNKGTDEVIVIDSAGYYVYSGVTAKNVRLMGGNFYIDNAGTLTTIKHMGTAAGNNLGVVTTKTGWNFSDVIRAGGNFMVRPNGTIVGINSENGFFTPDQKVDTRPKKIGGNYFIGDDNVLYTVSSTGELKKQQPVIGEMKYYGYSYMIDGDGDFIFVDGNGVPHTELVRVSTTGIKSAIVKQIKDGMDTHQNFIPALQ